MFTSRNVVVIIFLFVMILMAACTPTVGESGIAQAPEIFVFPMTTEDRLISTEDILQDNCNGSAEKSDTVERSHSVLRTLELGAGITVDAGGRAGIPGIGEVGVGAAVASHYQVSYGSEETVTRSTTVKAREGTSIQHTIRQYEVWEKGEVLISAGGINRRIPYSFRKDFRMETLPPANIGCPGQGVPAGATSYFEDVQPSPSQSEVTATQLAVPTAGNPVEDTQTYCPFLTNGHIEQLRAATSVSDALRQAEELAGHQQNDYKEGSTIPAGVVIATDLQNSNLSSFPVSSIKNQGGWGLFITSAEFIAPNDGTYWCIQ